MAIKQDNLDNVQVEVVKEAKPVEDVFGFEAEYTENTGYTTISGKEKTDVTNYTGYYIGDIEIGQTVTGKVEVDYFQNNDKDEITGEYSRKYQNIRVRVIDEEEYIDFYANIPRADENGFITGLNKNFEFFRTGFDLVFSFMRFIDETNVVTADGEEINRINRVNIVNIAKAIDKNERVKIKVIKGANEDYHSWIILDLQKEI